MRYAGWCYSFIIKPRFPYWDGCFEITEALKNNKVRGSFIDVMEDGKEYWRVLLLDTTKRKAEIVQEELKGRKLSSGSLKH